MAIKVTDSNGNTVKIAGRGMQGKPGEKGADGMSAYDYAVSGGYTGTEADFYSFLASGPTRIPAGILMISSTGAINEVGWRRVFKVNGQSLTLLTIGNSYSSGGPTSMLLSITTAVYYPDIAVLSSINYSRIDKCRLMYNQSSGEYFVDIHHNFASNNVFCANAIVNQGGWKPISAESMGFQPVSDAPEGETVVLEKTLM